MSVLVLAHLLFSDSIRLSAFSACISSESSIRFIRKAVSFLISKIDFSASFPRWMELPHLSFDRKAKLSNQLTQGFIVRKSI